LGEYAAKPNLPVWGPQQLFFKIDAYGSVRNAGRIWASTPQNREEIRRNTQAKTRLDLGIQNWIKKPKTK